MEKVAGGGVQWEADVSKEQQLAYFHKFLKDRKFVMSAEGALREAIKLNEEFGNTLVTAEDLTKIAAEVFEK